MLPSGPGPVNGRPANDRGEHQVKVGCIGLGDIAQKAYLPVLGALPGVELHLQTRTPATLIRVADGLRVPEGQRHTDLGSLLAQDLDAAFVHAPTAVHPEIVTRLLDAGVPTYVDKPLAYELADSVRLVELAERRGTSLAVGFNRRHAPGYAQCAEHPRELILLQKNRTGLPEEPRTMILDDFIHVVDTLRFLVPGTVDDVTVRARVRDGLLHHVVLQLAGDGFTALGVMNRLSGSAEEILEVSGQDTKRQVVNLAEVIDHKGQPTLRRRGDWVPVARQRGIEQAVLAFLDAVRAGTVLSARDALETHELCERVVREVLESAA
jgi:virulence factor